MKALVVGGTGPSGRAIVKGLLERGHHVSLLHTGQHELDFPVEVVHIHADPHFRDSLTEALNGCEFDSVIATYGRVRIIVDVVADKTNRLITISGSPFAGRGDPRWGSLGVPMIVPESGSPMQDAPPEPQGRQGGDPLTIIHRVWSTEQHLLDLHRQGVLSVTVLRYPLVYGPGAPANPDWSLVRRILDKREVLILGDNGRRIVNRGYGPNLARAVLSALDSPEISGGRVYNVADVAQYSQRAIASYIAELFGHSFRIVSVPGDLATQLHPGSDNDILGFYGYDTAAIRRDLGYVDEVPVPEAISRSVDWLVSHPLERSGEAERQLGDSFSYDVEDELARIYENARAQADTIALPRSDWTHMYRHPSKPGEGWKGPNKNTASNP